MNANWKCHVHPLWLIFALSYSTPVVVAQTKQVDRSQLINFPNSPLVFENVGKSFQIRNISSKTVARFTLACVVSKGKRSAAVFNFSAHESTFPPGYTSQEITVDGPSSLSVCVSRKAKLAVVDVLFSDGSEWLAPVRQAPTKSGEHFQSDDLDFWAGGPDAR